MLLLSIHSVFGQVELLRHRGNLPSELTTPSSLKYKRDLQNMEKTDKKSEKKEKDKFYLENNFALDGLLRSGKIIIEPEYSAYLGKVADALLEQNPELRSKVRFYLMRSAVVNAFATNDGSIFISLGLLAQLENEAQLAFILSHELAHVEKRHALDFFLKSRRIERGKMDKDIQRDNNIADRQLAKHAFSRDQETSADDIGLERYLKTNYSLVATERAMDVLRYAYLPFDDVTFDRNFFETDYIRFPKYMFKDSVRSIEGTDENEDDKRSTHPNISKRKAALLQKIAGKTENGKRDFIISEEMFKRLQQQARYELPSIYNVNGEYQSAIYASFLLKKAGGDETFVDQQVAKSLYNFSKFKTHSDIVATAEEIESDSIEGESQQVYHFFNRMTKKELNVLTVSYLWRMHQKYPKDDEIGRMKRDALWQLVRYDSVTLADFVLEKPDTATSSAPPPSITTEKKEEKPAKDVVKDDAPKKEKTKYDKIKEKNALKPTTTESKKVDWSRHALGDLLADADFKKKFEEMVVDAEKDLKAEPSAETIKAERKKRLPMNLKKVVFVNPFYARLDIREQEAERLHLETEEGNKRLCRLVKENAAMVGLETVTLATQELTSNDTEKFNDIVALNQWFSEQNDAGKHFVVPTNQAKVEEIAKKYGTDYFVWSGVISARQNSSGWLTAWAYIFYPFGLPTAFRTAIDSKNDGLIFVMVYNVRTGQNETVKFFVLNGKDTNMKLNAHLYDAILQIRGKGGAATAVEKTPKPTATSTSTPPPPPPPATSQPLPPNAKPKAGNPKSKLKSSKNKN